MKCNIIVIIFFLTKEYNKKFENILKHVSTKFLVYIRITGMQKTTSTSIPRKLSTPCAPIKTTPIKIFIL